MFILSGFSRKMPFTVTRRNGLVTIECADGPIAYRAMEARQPVQYLCGVHTDGKTILTKNLEQSKMLAVETIYEGERTAVQDASYNKLIDDFGDKGSRERAKRREIGTLSRVQAVQFNVENQVLPEFDHTADDVRNVYKLELLFSGETIKCFGKMHIDFSDLCYLVKKHSINDRNRVILMAIDCLYKVVAAKNMAAVPDIYRFFTREISDGILNGRLSLLTKDRLVVKTYILLLMVNNYKMHYDDVPKFDIGKSKVMGMLRAIGCKIESDTVILHKLPQATYSVR